MYCTPGEAARKGRLSRSRKAPFVSKNTAFPCCPGDTSSGPFYFPCSQISECCSCSRSCSCSPFSSSSSSSSSSDHLRPRPPRPRPLRPAGCCCCCCCRRRRRCCCCSSLLCQLLISMDPSRYNRAVLMSEGGGEAHCLSLPLSPSFTAFHRGSAASAEHVAAEELVREVVEKQVVPTPPALLSLSSRHHFPRLSLSCISVSSRVSPFLSAPAPSP